MRSTHLKNLLIATSIFWFSVFSSTAFSQDCPAGTPRAVDPKGKDLIETSPVIRCNSPAGSGDVNTFVRLVTNPDAGSVATGDLVTFGIPFAEGVLTDIDRVAIRDVSGAEISAYVAEGLPWRGAVDSIMSVVVQVAKPSGNNITLNVDLNRLSDAATDVARRTKANIQTGMVQAPASKGRVPMPKVYVLHDPAYLATADISTPWSPAPSGGDALNGWLDPLFDSQHDFDSMDYTGQGTLEWYQFDRSARLYERYMSTGDIKYLREASAMHHFYMDNVNKTNNIASGDGTCRTSGRGGFNTPYNNGAGGSCTDAKIIFTEHAKIHFVLTGDNTAFTDDNLDMVDFVQDMSEMAEVGFWQAPIPNSTITDICDGFTERNAGVQLWNHVTVCQMTGAAEACGRVDRIISVLKDLQQTPKSWDVANGWATGSGMFRHSYLSHEVSGGDCRAQNGGNSADDRMSSPWMSVMAAKGLWMAYWHLDSTLISGHSDLPEMIRLLGQAINNYAFNDSPLGAAAPNHRALEATNFTNVQGNPRFGCNQPEGPFAFYFMSDIASPQQITGHPSGIFYGDSHVPEMLSPIAYAYHFEQDPQKRASLSQRATQIRSMQENCPGTEWSNPPRAVSWTQIGNPWRTWDWVSK